MIYGLTVEDLCKKLRPIFGTKIDKVYLKYKLADSLEAKQEIEQALKPLAGLIDEKTIRHLNSEVDLKKRSVKSVAHEFLKEKKLAE